ncbi:MAG: glycosyltransferase [Flavobacterium sp.]
MLAIVIPYYKSAYFEQTLQSLENQTNRQFSVYIGDDASPENPAGIISKFEGKIAINYKRFDQNFGGISLTKQWKRCLEMTQDEQWVMILGDDDVLGENVVEEFYDSIEKIKENNCNVIRLATQKIDNDSNIRSDVYQHPEVEKSTAFLTRIYAENSRSSLSEYIFNKEILMRKGIIDFPVAWHSDIVLVLEISDFKEVYSINSAVVSVRVSQESISGSNSYIKPKAKADFQFAGYLIRNLRKFTPEEQKAIIPRIEKLALNNRKQFKFGLKIILLYLSRMEFPKTFSFIYKSIKK